MLIGICGKAGAGKDTIGDYLIDKYGFEQMGLADPIKRLVMDVFVLDEHTVYDRVAREQPLENWPGWTVRKFLQFIGTELFRKQIDDAVWVKSLALRIKKSDKDYVVTDIRFPNELEILKEIGGDDFMSIKVTRPGHEGGVGLAGHESEAYDLETQHVLNNDGTMEDLYNKVDEITKEMS